MAYKRIDGGLEKRCVWPLNMPIIYSSEGYLPWRIASGVIEFQMAWFCGCLFGFALGMRLKRMLDEDCDPLPFLSQSRSWTPPSPRTNQKAAPTLLGIVDSAQLLSPHEFPCT